MVQIVGGECGADVRFAMFEKAGEQAGGDFRVVGKLGLFDESTAKADSGAVLRVIGAAGELDEAASAEALAVGAADVAELRARIVEIEGMATGGSIEVALAFAGGCERCGFGVNSGERHQDHLLVGEIFGDQSVQHVGKIGLDVRVRRERKHAPRHLDSDVGNERDDVHRAGGSLILAVAVARGGEARAGTGYTMSG